MGRRSGVFSYYAAEPLYNKHMSGTGKKIIKILIYGLFFLFFLVIFHLTPPAGDDWVYANAMKESSLIANTLKFYQTWSGRVLGEFFSFLYASHRHLWEVMNAGVLTGTVYLITRLKKDDSASGTMFLMFLFLSVPYYLRAQTYTFIVGSAAYLVPLPLLVLYLILLKDLISDGNISPLRTFCGVICVFALTLFMQNLSALTVFLSLMACGYSFRKNRCRKETLLFSAVSIIGTLIIALSPGSSFRMGRDFPEFAALGLIGKTAVNLKQFLYLTFFYHKALMVILCGLLVLRIRSLFQGKKQILLSVIMAVHALLCLSGGTGIIAADCLWAAVFTAALLYVSAEGKDPLLMTGLILGAGAANAVMMVSPVFGDRSALYTVVLLMIYAFMIFEPEEMPLQNRSLIPAALAAGILISAGKLTAVYRIVRDVSAVRYSQTEYYRIRPDAEEAWFLAYPDHTVHSADIEESDTVHIEAFRTFYWIGEKTRIRFYYLDDYSHERLMQERKQ